MENRELVDTSSPLGRSKRHIEIVLPTGASYRAGDYLSVLPENPARQYRPGTTPLWTCLRRSGDSPLSSRHTNVFSDWTAGYGRGIADQLR